jgi:predicted RNA-binding protein with PIN domain
MKEARSRHREQLAAVKEENSDLRRKLGDSRGRLRSADAAREAAETKLEELKANAQAATARHDTDLRRLRLRVEELERELASVRRSGRAERGAEALRARLLLDTLLDAAQGLRRELGLPAVEGAPADSVAADLADEGDRPLSGERSLGSHEPALLEQLFTLPRVHVIVDGYNVTKAAWPDLSLERQRGRLLAGLGPLAARFGMEATVVFDAAETSNRPVVSSPRGLRVLYSPAGVIADDVIRDLVAAEPHGRPVVVVTSDSDVARDVRRAGARSVPAAALVGLLGRS